jgi:hypothetical protein
MRPGSNRTNLNASVGALRCAMLLHEVLPAPAPGGEQKKEQE